MQGSDFKNAPRAIGLAIIMAPDEMVELEGPRSFNPQQDREFGSRLMSVVSGIMSFGAIKNPFIARQVAKALCAAHPRVRLPLVLGMIREDPEAFDSMFESLSSTRRNSDRIARFNLATTIGSFARHSILIEALHQESLDEVSEIMAKIRNRRGKK